MLGYALDTIRGAALRPGQDGYRGAHRGRDPRAGVKTARWLLFLPAALAGLLAFLSLSLLLIYLVSLGTGLGLDISWRIVVNRHHGDLRVESVPGNTRLQVRLPLTGPQDDR